jgi:hypothetical protein
VALLLQLLLVQPTAPSPLPVGSGKFQQVSSTLQSQAALWTSSSPSLRQQQQHLPARLTLQESVIHRSPQHRLPCMQHTPRQCPAHLVHASRAAGLLLMVVVVVMA